MERTNPFSPTGRVVNTVELLDGILSFLVLKDVATCARVCKNWVDVSLDHIWEDVPGFGPLFEVLAPLAMQDEDEDINPLVFSRPITIHDWRRLTPLLRRVKTFTMGQFDGIGKGYMYMDDSVYEKVLTTRPSTTFLPNLRKLVVKAQDRHFERAEQYLLVLSESITTLEFFMLKSPLTAPNLIYFMREAAERAPNIKKISFCDQCSRDVLQDQLHEIYPKFTSLQTISLSSCAITSTMISALSSLPSLEVIHHGWWGTNGRTTSVANIHDVVLRAEKGVPFPKLRAFALQSRLPSVIRFLSEKFNPSNLGRLTIDVISTMRSKDLSKLLQLLSQTCKSLSALQVTQHEDITAPPGEPITANALRYLQDIPHLQTMTLDHSRNLSISNQELAGIIISCRNLKSIRFRRDPTVIGDEPSSITLELFSILADAGTRTKLTDLWADIDARQPPSPRPILSKTLRLRNLFFGFSVALPEEVNKIAAYLDSVLDKSVVSNLITDTTLLLSQRRQELINNSRLKHLVDRAALWKSVSDSLELVMVSRKRTEEETQLLRKKIAHLGKELKQVRRKLADVTNQDQSQVGADASIEVMDDSADTDGLLGTIDTQPGDGA